MTVKVQFRRGTAAGWTSANPTLAEGEMGLELDTGYFKIGNGSDNWNGLDYAAPATLTGLTPGSVVFGSSTGTAAQNEAGTAGQFLMSYGDIANGGPRMVDVSIKESIHVATTEHLDATYNNANITTGDYPVIASSLTMNAIGHTFIDGIELELDDRVLIKDQNDPIQNGIYVVIQEGEDVGEDPATPLGQATIFVRDNDSDTASKIACALAQVQNGAVNGGQMFTTYFAESDILGTTPIIYNNIVQTGGTGRAGEFLMSYGGYGVHAPQFVQLNVHEPVSVATIEPLDVSYVLGEDINITAITSDASTWTFTYSGAPFTGYTPTVNQPIVISGCTPLAYNGTYTVATASTTQFTITQAGNPGTGTIFGTALQGDTSLDPSVISDELILTSSGELYIDGEKVLLDDRVLVKDQTNPVQNGIWLCTTQGSSGVSARFSRDNDANAIDKLPASLVQVINGDVNAGQTFTTYVSGAGVLGFDPIVWNTVVQAPGSGRAGEFLMSYGGYGVNAPQYVQLNVHEPMIAASASGVNYPVTTYVKGATVHLTAVTSTTSTWTFTYTGAPYVGYAPVVGQPIVVENCIPLAYNGTWTVATSSTTQFTVTQTGNPGTATTLGYAEQGIEDIDPQDPSDYMILSTAGALIVDGYTALVDDRILLKDQTSAYQNGIWIVSDTGTGTGTSGYPILSRDNDANVPDKLSASLVQVIGGNTNAGTTWQCTLSSGGIFGVTNVNFVKLSSNLSIAQTGLTTAVSYATETNVASLTIPQNYLQAGSTFRLKMQGFRTGATSATEVVNVRIGTTNSATAGNIAATVTIAATATASPFYVESVVTVRTGGSSGTISGSCESIYGSTILFSPTNTAITPVAVDTTGLNYLKFTLQSASNTFTIQNATIEQIV